MGGHPFAPRRGEPQAQGVMGGAVFLRFGGRDVPEVQGVMGDAICPKKAPEPPNLRKGA